MRIDSHQHFWKYNSSDYVWMTDSMDLLRQDRLPNDLEPQLAEIGFQGTIAVQARQLERETEWLLDLSSEYDFIQGVVGWVDFESPDLDRALEKFAAFPKLRGVRELIHDMPDVDYAIGETHTRAIAKLEQYGLGYDLLLRPKHLRPALKLAPIPQPTLCRRSHRKARHRITAAAALAGRYSGPGEMPKRVLQAVRHGDGSGLDALARLNISSVFGRGRRSLWHKSGDDWLGLAGLHAVGFLFVNDGHCDQLRRRAF